MRHEIGISLTALVNKRELVLRVVSTVNRRRIRRFKNIIVTLGLCRGTLHLRHHQVSMRPLYLSLGEASHVFIHVKLMLLIHVLLLLLLELFRIDKILISVVARLHATGGHWQAMQL